MKIKDNQFLSIWFLGMAMMCAYAPDFYNPGAGTIVTVLLGFSLLAAMWIGGNK